MIAAHLPPPAIIRTAPCQNSASCLLAGPLQTLSSTEPTCLTFTRSDGKLFLKMCNDGTATADPSIKADIAARQVIKELIQEWPTTCKQKSEENK